MIKRIFLKLKLNTDAVKEKHGAIIIPLMKKRKSYFLKQTKQFTSKGLTCLKENILIISSVLI